MIKINGEPSCLCPTCGENDMKWVTDGKRFPGVKCSSCGYGMGWVEDMPPVSPYMAFRVMMSRLWCRKRKGWQRSM